MILSVHVVPDLGSPVELIHIKLLGLPDFPDQFPIGAMFRVGCRNGILRPVHYLFENGHNILWRRLAYLHHAARRGSRSVVSSVLLQG